MGWMSNLSETYDRCKEEIGDITDPKKVPLLPICHTTQIAHLEITLNDMGEFIRARWLEPAESRTIIPCTEKSANRTGGLAAHPLADKLQYIARDYSKHVDKREGFEEYEKLLRDWNMVAGYYKINSIYTYIRNNDVIADLINCKILSVNDDGIIDGWTADKPSVCKIMSDPSDSFVRWSVEKPGDPHCTLHDDPLAWESWQSYYLKTINNIGVCLVTGVEGGVAELHPNKIRNDGDKAKLISSNDNVGFTFRGRFEQANEACTVLYAITQKAHNCLKWLISKQGFKNQDQVILAWSSMNIEIINPADDIFSQIVGPDILSERVAYTGKEAAKKINSMIAGYLSDCLTDNITIIGLDSATVGRLSITYYKELTSSDFLEKISNWYTTCNWDLRYTVDKESFFVQRSPAPKEIAAATFGGRNEKLIKSTIERLLPCIIDGRPLPVDIVTTIVDKASQPLSEQSSTWEWDNKLRLACALFRKSKEKEEYSLTLDENRKTRDYLYGRLLAIANHLERSALQKAGEDRPTNAMRLMYRFFQRPYSTWPIIEHALLPYKVRLGPIAGFFEMKIGEVMDKFSAEDFTDDSPLTGEYLLGFYSQRQELYRKKTDEIDNDN